MVREYLIKIIAEDRHVIEGVPTILWLKKWRADLPCAY